MEGVGARLGRTSTRYGPTTVFTGPVRKWKKKWVHVSPSAAPPSNNHNNITSSSHHPHHSQSPTNGNNGSHVLLYKWAPISQSQNPSTTTAADKTPVKENAGEEPPRRKFKYIPIAALEEQIEEAVEQVEEEAKPEDTNPTAMETTYKSEEKPDINDVPMEENQDPDDNQTERQDLNKSTLDLSLGLTAHDGDHGSDSQTNQE